MTDLRRHSKEIMKTKESEIIGLRTEVATLTNELKKLKSYDNVSKHTEALEVTRKTIISLKAQIEDDKRTEENLRIQLLKKEDSWHLLEVEVEDLRKKDKNKNTYIKFKETSAILDKILHS